MVVFSMIYSFQSGILMFLASGSLFFCLAVVVIGIIKRRAGRRKIIRQIEQMASRLPTALDSPLDALSCNDPIPIYSGLLTLNSDEWEGTGSGEVIFRWLPEPRVVFQGCFASVALLETLSNAVLQIDDFEPARSELVSINIRDGIHACRLGGVLLDSLCPRLPEEGSKQFNFFLANFVPYIGTRVRSCRNPLSVGSRRWTLKADEWDVVIDLVEPSGKVMDSLKLNGGFGITHIGRVSRNNHAHTTAEDYNQISRVLRYYLGFCRGFWVGPMLPFVENLNKKLFYYSSYRLTPWQSVGSWFPRQKPLEAGKSFKQFVRLFQDSDWTDALVYSIEWYIDANTADTLESSIVKMQFGLEVLAWMMLVRKGAKSKSQYEADSATQNLQELHIEMNIPVDVPSSLRALEQYATSLDPPSGVRAITKIRNYIAHPTSSNIEKLSSVGSSTMFEAKQLGLHYLELCLLHVIGYSGVYSDRTKSSRHEGEYDAVPWLNRL